MSPITEQARKLGDTLEFYGKKQFTHPDEQLEQQEELDWNAPYFYAQVLREAVESDYYFLDRNRLLKLEEEYNQTTNGNIDSAQLIQDGWLRIVYGCTYIPNVVSDAARARVKLGSLKSELSFLIGVQKTAGKGAKVGSEAFHDMVVNYEEEHGLMLDLHGAKEHHLWEEKDEVVTIQNPGYYEALLPLWAPLHFIHYVYEHLHSKGAQNELRIRAGTLQGIVGKFSQLFPKTPALRRWLLPKNSASIAITALFSSRISIARCTKRPLSCGGSFWTTTVSRTTERASHSGTKELFIEAIIGAT